MKDTTSPKIEILAQISKKLAAQLERFEAGKEPMEDATLYDVGGVRSISTFNGSFQKQDGVWMRNKVVKNPDYQPEQYKYMTVADATQTEVKIFVIQYPNVSWRKQILPALRHLVREQNLCPLNRLVIDGTDEAHFKKTRHLRLSFSEGIFIPYSDTDSERYKKTITQYEMITVKKQIKDLTIHISQEYNLFHESGHIKFVVFKNKHILIVGQSTTIPPKGKLTKDNVEKFDLVRKELNRYNY